MCISNEYAFQAILASNPEDVERPAKILIREAEEIDLQLNYDKTKYTIVENSTRTLESQKRENYSKIG